MSREGSLTDFIAACYEQNLPKAEFMDCCQKSLLAVTTRKLEEVDDPCAWVPPAHSDQGLRIASIFIIIVASSIGVAFPLLAKYHKKLNIHHYSIVLGKCAGTGVLLSCALVHMILPSNESLTSECVPTIFNTTYPAFAYVLPLAAIVGMHAFEALFTSFFSSRTPADTCDLLEEVRFDEDSNSGLSVDDNAIPGKENADKHQKDVAGDQLLICSDQDKKINLKHISEACVIEFAIAVHSLLIGLTFGVTGENDLVALLVALVFHQLFEGVSLGSRLADTTLGVWNEVLLGGIFAVSAPVGIVMGMGVHKNLNTNGGTYLVVQGVLDGICGGILLYTGFTFLLEDFGRDMELHCRGKYRRLMQAGMFVTLWWFAGFMSLIGKYL